MSVEFDVCPVFHSYASTVTVCHSNIYACGTEYHQIRPEECLAGPSLSCSTSAKAAKSGTPGKRWTEEGWQVESSEEPEEFYLPESSLASQIYVCMHIRRGSKLITLDGKLQMCTIFNDSYLMKFAFPCSKNLNHEFSLYKNSIATKTTIISTILDIFTRLPWGLSNNLWARVWLQRQHLHQCVPATSCKFLVEMIFWKPIKFGPFLCTYALDVKSSSS